MSVPTLNEITSIKGDPEIAYGTQGIGGTNVVLPADKGMEAMMQFYQAKAARDKDVYNKYQLNLRQAMDNFDKLEMKDVLPSDIPILTSLYADATSAMSNNPSTLSNPSSDPTKYAQIQSKVSNLKSAIAASQAAKAVWKESQDLLKNQGWSNPENEAALKAYVESPILQRTVPSFMRNLTYSPIEDTKRAQEIAVQKYAKDYVQTGLSPTDPKAEWMTNEKGETYLLSDYRNAMRSLLTGTLDKDNPGINNLSVLKRSVYDKDPELQKKFGTFSNWVDNGFIPDTMPKNKVTDESVTASPFQIQRRSQAFEAGEAAKRRAHDFALKDYDKAEQGRESVEVLGRLAQGQSIPKTLGQAMFGSSPAETVAISAKQYEALKGTDEESEVVKTTGEDGSTSYRVPATLYVNNGILPKAQGLKPVAIVKEWDPKLGYVDKTMEIPNRELQKYSYRIYGPGVSTSKIADAQAAYNKKYGIDPLNPNLSQIGQLFQLDPNNINIYDPSTKKLYNAAGYSATGAPYDVNRYSDDTRPKEYRSPEQLLTPTGDVARPAWFQETVDAVRGGPATIPTQPVPGTQQPAPAPTNTKTPVPPKLGNDQPQPAGKLQSEAQKRFPRLYYSRTDAQGYLVDDSGTRVKDINGNFVKK